MSDRSRYATPVAVDAHVIEGRPQGSRTTLLCLLREIAALGRAGDFALYCTDPELCRERLGVGGFHYVETPRAGSIKRLIWTLPRALWATSAKSAVWQYISTPFFRGKNYVVIHDVLPFTHPHLFPFGFRLRCQILFTLSMFGAEKIFVVSEFSRNAVALLYPSLARKLAVVPNGPSFPLEAYFVAERSQSPRSRPYVMTVGRIEERKNIPLLANAFIAAGLKDVDLIVVGKSDLTGSSPLPIHPNIRVLDKADDGELQALYLGAALFVFPSQAEGFGIPLLDAILFGIPTISSSLTAMTEVAGDCAALFDPTSRDASTNLTSMIRGHFAHNPIPAPTLEQRQRQSNKFSWKRSAEIFLHEISR